MIGPTASDINSNIGVGYIPAMRMNMVSTDNTET
jgi:hypothetical protein